MMCQQPNVAVITRTVTPKNLEGELIDLQAAAKSVAESPLNKPRICKKKWKKQRLKYAFRFQTQSKAA